MYYVTTGMSHKWAMQMGPTYYTWRTRGIGLRITACLVLRFENGFLYLKTEKK